MAELIASGSPTKVEIAEAVASPTFTTLGVCRFRVENSSASNEEETFETLCGGDRQSSIKHVVSLSLYDLDATAGGARAVLDALVGKDVIVRVTRNGVVQTHGSSTAGLLLRKLDMPTMTGDPSMVSYIAGRKFGPSIAPVTYA